VTVKIYVEGGGDHNKALQTECRRGFSEFFRKAGLKDRMPRVVACGGRRHAYDSFRTSHENAGQDDPPILFVDSEARLSRKIRGNMSGCGRAMGRIGLKAGLPAGRSESESEHREHP